MTEPPSDRCGYTWPEPYRGSIYISGNCCYRKSYSEYDKCIWHLESKKVETKPINELKKARTPPEIRDLNANYSELLTGVVLEGLDLEDAISFEDVCLRDADLSNAKLSDANLSGADLFKTNLNDASLFEADLTGAHLESTDVTDTSFFRANLTDARLDILELENNSFWGANLTNVSFQETIFDDVNLYGADLSGSNMRYVELKHVDIDHETTLGRQKRAEKDADGPRDWDLIAQAHHEFKSVFSDHGFTGKARNQHFWHRRARGLQAKAASNRFEGWLNPTYLGSLASRLFTGYGVRVSYLLIWMVLLFSFSTLWYIYTGVEDTVLNNVAYSIFAFTAAPSEIPLRSTTKLVVMAETFLGTLLIVLLGYILGNRERF